jgi:hypothetical protein
MAEYSEGGQGSTWTVAPRSSSSREPEAPYENLASVPLSSQEIPQGIPSSP